jgi:branched-subunit amino acid aminotransferase/4-amino-4-deoxychorismate lyase
MAESSTFLFRSGALIPVALERLAVLVADSFVVENGQAVALERHFDRFSRSTLASTDLSPDQLRDFLFWTAAAIPRTGVWFPKIECVRAKGGVVLRYIQRPCPPRSSAAILARATEDPRTSPTVKGPDLEALGELRKSVSKYGADEALIVDHSDTIVEGAWSSLVVWSDNGRALDITPTRFPRVQSVTESVVIDIARSQGVKVRARATKVNDLAGREAWVLSALHGIRVVTHLHQGPALTALPGRREGYQELWQRTATPLDKL